MECITNEDLKQLDNEELIELLVSLETIDNNLKLSEDEEMDGNE